MAIKFETVTGNQASANVLAQINNNFAKINSSPVPKAEFATNADTVDNKHASELIPGAATFLNSITSLANLSIGRYFCTQTRQSWEPVTTTGSRTFLIEVSLNTPNNLKSYKINYIAGAGAGESYYSDYSGGSIRWNRIVNDKNISSLDATKITYDRNNQPGKVSVYDNLICFPEKTEKNGISSQGYFPINNGTGRYFRAVLNVTTLASDHICDSCGSGYDTYKYRFTLTMYIYNSNLGLIKTVTSTNSLDETSLSGGAANAGICGYIGNLDTGDIIVPFYKRGQAWSGVFYYSAATETIIYTGGNISLGYYYNRSGSISVDVYMPTYWYNEHFGQFYYSDYCDQYTASCHCVQLNSNRNAVVTTTDITIGNVGGGYSDIGQIGNEVFIYGKNATVFKMTISSRSIQSVNTGITMDQYPSMGPGVIDRNGQYLYIILSGTPVKLNTSLTVLNKGPKRNEAPYLIETENYIIQFQSNSSSSTCYCLNKSNLSTVSTYNKVIYNNGYLNKPISVFSLSYGWFKQTIHNGQSTEGISLSGNRILSGDTTYFYSNANFGLHEIFQANNGVLVGYFANYLEPSIFSDTVIFKFDGLGCLYKNKVIDDSKNAKLLKSFIYN